MSDYPHIDGDFLSIGPECFTNESTGVASLPDKQHAVICWRGENYYRIDCLPEWWLRELAYMSAGAGAGAVMSEPGGGDIVMPTEKITEAIEALIAEFQRPREHIEV
jgi:hypothetical protein